MAEIVPASVGVSISEKVEYTASGLRFNAALSYAEWIEVGKKLRSVEKALHWAIGDWLLYGEHKFGEKYSQAEVETGFSIETLKKDQWVASRFPPHLRRLDVNFSHYLLVAALPQKDATALIDKAAERHLSVRDLKTVTEVYKAARDGKLPYEQPAIPPPIEEETVSAEPVREWEYIAWYVVQVHEDEDLKCSLCGERGKVGPEVHLCRLTRRELPTDRDLAEHAEQIAELNKLVPPGEPPYQYDWQGKTESKIVCARCLWSLTS